MVDGGERRDDDGGELVVQYGYHDEEGWKQLSLPSAAGWVSFSRKMFVCIFPTSFCLSFACRSSVGLSVAVCVSVCLCGSSAD